MPEWRWSPPRVRSQKSDPQLPELLFPAEEPEDSSFLTTYGGQVASRAPKGHGQETAPALMNCPECRAGNCEGCPDRVFLILGKDPICTCGKAGHQDAIAGEPRRLQVEDPFTGDVHGPGLKVSKEGVVERTTRPSEIPNGRSQGGS